MRTLPALAYASSLSFFFLFSFLSAANGSAAEISYPDHCASLVAESEPTVRVPIRHSQLLDITTNYYFWGGGGEKIVALIKSSSDQSMNVSDAHVTFLTTGNVFETITKGIYKYEANLVFEVPGAYRRSRVNSDYRSRYTYRPLRLKFLLNGFYSEASRKLCMVGAGFLRSGESKSLKFEAVLKVNYAKKNSTLFTGLAKGSFRSLSSSDSSTYFEPIQIVSFPVLHDYNYTLSPKEHGGSCLEGNDVPPKNLLSLQHTSICSTFQRRSYVFDLEYASGCNSSQDCSPFEEDGHPHPYLSLFAFQCSESEGKLRYVISFQNQRYRWFYGSLVDPNRTLIGEGSWDSERNQLCIIACRVLNPFKSLGDVKVGNCSVRLNLRIPLVWTIKNTTSILGLVWTDKKATDGGFFKNIKLSSSISTINNGMGMQLPGVRYEYTEIQKVRELCPRNQDVKKSGDRYPKGGSHDMRFYMSAELSKEKIAWIDAVPIAVGNELYGNSVISIDDYGEEEESTSHSSLLMNISYKLTRTSIQGQNQSFPITEISGEGTYDAETGTLCMVGCREMHLQNRSEDSMDCEIFMNFQLPSLDSKVGSSIQGFIHSRRAKNDPLYFKPLKISGHTYYRIHAQKTIRRMDLEIILVLISNTMLCIFVASQIFYIKKHPQVLPFISLVMLITLTLGHMIPLVLNLEALLLKNHNQQQEVLLQGQGEGSLEWYEVSVRLVSLVAFLLLLRLLQTAWTARMENGGGKKLWAEEKKTAFVTLLLYGVGGGITLLAEWRRRKTGIGNEVLISSASTSTLTYLKSYGGLVLDGFLLPQIIHNIFQNSAENALCCLFYIGITSVRLFPHAYDLYRAQSYLRQDFSGSYIYANPSADFYSIAWDLIIPCGCILLAVIIWLQQRRGGRCILPRKIGQLGSYEKVPADVSDE